MKHDRLCAIGHNLADSMASGLGFVIGYHPMDVFGEAASSYGGVIEVDFLNGRVVRGEASGNLKAAAPDLQKRCRTFAESTVRRRQTFWCCQ